MTITKILTAALLPCALMAAPAFAQSSATKADDYAKEKVTSEVKDAVKEDAKDMATDASKEMMKPDTGMMIKGQEIATHSKMDKVGSDMKEDHTLIITTSDDVVSINDDGTTVTEKPKMMETPATVTTVVTACPEGTTAQDDGTCMITGDYEE